MYFRHLLGCDTIEPLCMAIINSNEKKIIYNFGNDFCFQNEELSLQFNWTGGFLHM